MKNYGSKDLMRMESIRDKANGDYMHQLLYAYNMSSAITEPGKAMARGYAAQEFFGEHAAIAQIFFERAYDLGGEDVRPEASVNPLDTSDEGIEELYTEIPENEQPASRRENKLILKGQTSRRTSFSNLVSLGKLNLIKGTGPQFNLYEYPSGTIEIWQTESGKPRMIYTGNYEPNFFIGESRTFKYLDKSETWTLIDYIESEFISNLVPLYGKSILIYNYN